MIELNKTDLFFSYKVSVLGSNDVFCDIYIMTDHKEKEFLRFAIYCSRIISQYSYRHSERRNKVSTLLW